MGTTFEDMSSVILDPLQKTADKASSLLQKMQGASSSIFFDLEYLSLSSLFNLSIS